MIFPCTDVVGELILEIFWRLCSSGRRPFQLLEKDHGGTHRLLTGEQFLQMG
jgi:hypothetical protein